MTPGKDNIPFSKIMLLKRILTGNSIANQQDRIKRKEPGTIPSSPTSYIITDSYNSLGASHFYLFIFAFTSPIDSAFPNSSIVKDSLP